MVQRVSLRHTQLLNRPSLALLALVLGGMRGGSPPIGCAFDQTLQVLSEQGQRRNRGDLRMFAAHLIRPLHQG
jgi:hypothetical protein